MQGFWDCAFYLIFLMLAAFPLGRILPYRWFREDRFPFKSFAFEKEGRIYNRLQIRNWENKLPDMSRYLPRYIPRKRLSDEALEELPVLIKETCIAETIHILLCLLGFACMHIWPAEGGLILAMIFFFGNLPYILIQRHNRPRLIRLQNRLQRRLPD